MAIRRILGASKRDILSLVVGTTARQTIFAFVFALPIAWYGANRWLEGFGARIDLNLTPFIVAALLVLGFSLLASSYQYWRLVSWKPSESLRYE